MRESSEPCTCRDVLNVDRLSSDVEAPSKWHSSAFRAEMRAIEQGHKAFMRTGSTEGDVIQFDVVSNCRHAVKHHQHVYLKPGARLPIKIACSCEAGTHRAWAPIPCKHAALVARSLERRGWVEWNEGLWWHPDAWAAKKDLEARTAHVDEHPDDPFEGLAP